MTDGFVLQTDNNRKQRFIALVVTILLVGAGIATLVLSYIYAAPNVAGESFLSRYTPGFLADIGPAKQFIISTMSGMIIFPIPNEAAFYLGLRQGHSAIATVLATALGFALGNAVTYMLGLKFSKHIVYLLSTSQIYRLRRSVNHYGVYAILVLNLLPAPSDVLTFGLGMIRYNTKRLFAILIIANIVKFSLYAYMISFMT